MSTSGSAAAAAAAAEADERRTARWAGLCFLLPFLLYGAGDRQMRSLTSRKDFMQHPPCMEVMLAGLLLLSNCVCVIVLALKLHTLVSRHAPRLALFYVCVRLAQGAHLAGGTFSQLLLCPLAQARARGVAGGAEDWLYSSLAIVALQANHYALQLSSLVLGLGSCPLFIFMLRRRLLNLPRLMSAWALLGYALLAAGALAELVWGLPLGKRAALPASGLEVALGLWLLAGRAVPAPRAGVAASPATKAA